MTRNEFIFSKARRYRLARHLLFWAAWCIAYLLLFHYPIHSFKGWDIHSPNDGFQNKFSVAAFVVKTLVFNTALSVVLPQALLIYFLLYYILPNYFFKRKHPLVTAGMITATLVVYYIVALHFKYATVLGNILLSAKKAVVPYANLWTIIAYSAIREILISLPLVAGFALAIKLMKRWWLKEKEAQMLASEKTSAELQLLKAQVHPHFLFNTLNNIYYFTLTASPKAPEMIGKLSGLLQYIINECNKELVPLDKEIEMIEDYMALEKIRYGEQMQMEINISAKGTQGMIAPLLLIPFVENSFKHGTSKMLEHPWVKMNITVEKNSLIFFIINSQPATVDQTLKKGKIGLRNVKQRLQLLYPKAHQLRIVSELESFAVYMEVPLKYTALQPAIHNTTLKPAAYEWA